MIESDIYAPDPADGIAPDQWSSIRLGLRQAPRATLDRLTAQYLERGGQICTLEPAPNEVTRQHPYYYPDTLPEVKGPEYTTWQALPTDGPLIKKVDKLLASQWESRKAMAEALGVGDGTLQRILYVHFKADDRATKFQRLGRTEAKRKATEELWERRKLIVELILEQGIVGYEKVAAASGLSVNMLYTLVDRYDLPIQKFRRPSNENAD